MLKTIFFDCDGVVIARRQRFLQRFAQEYDVPENKIWPFFQNEFLRCEIGKADLKQELKKYLPKWEYKQPVEDLLDFWFKGESEIDKVILDYIQSLRAQGIACYLATNNEKYRSMYLMSHLKLGEAFDEFFTSAHLGYFKNQEEFWQQAYDYKMGGKHEILVVDDSQEVVDAAKKFGFYSHFYHGLDDLQTYIEQLLKI